MRLAAYATLPLALLLMVGCASSPPPRARPMSGPILPQQIEGPGDTALYGVVLGKPLGGMNECEYQNRIYDRKQLEYTGLSPSSVPCYQRPKELIGSPVTLGTETLLVNWPLSEKPGMFRNNNAVVRLINGVVHRVTATTRGVGSQVADKERLTEKFGPPKKSWTDTTQTRLGAKYEVLNAYWARSGGVQVRLFGALTRVDEGHLEAVTPLGEEDQRQERDRIFGSGRKL